MAAPRNETPAVSSSRSQFVNKCVMDRSLFVKPATHIHPTRYLLPEVTATHVASLYAAVLWYVTRTARKPR
jgi:hypothetical protein